MARTFIEYQRESATLVRPAIRAAAELGGADPTKTVRASIHRRMTEFVEALARA